MRKKLLLALLFIFSTVLVGCFDTTNDNTNLNTNNGKMSYQITYTNTVLEKNSIGTVWVFAIAEITNTGDTDLFLESGSIDLEDESGNLIKVLNYVSVFPQIISPGEKAYYYDETTIDNVSENTNLSAKLHPEIVKSKSTKINFPVSDVVLTDEDYFGIKATGRVENTSQEDAGLLYIAIILFDSNDKPMAVLFTIESVNAGVKKGFSASALSLPDNITTTTVARFVAVAYTRQFQFS